MIEEYGTVVEAKEKTALIKAKRTTSCDSCVSKSLCTGVAETDMLIEAQNPLNARAGDHVVFMVGAGSVIKAGMLFYLFPLLGFIAGVVLGQVFAEKIPLKWDSDIISALAGFFFLALTYGGISLYGRHAEKKRTYMPTIVRIV